MEAVQKTLNSQLLRQAGTQLETQSLNAIVAGFGFASAIAWMDVVRSIVARVGKQAGLSSNGATQSAMIALLTTLLSVVVFMVMSRLSKRAPKEAAAPVYAVTA